MKRWPLVADHTFILATRDTGYRSPAAAIAELIDNALQAGARHIHIRVGEDRQLEHDRASGQSTIDRARGGQRRIGLAVLDDGSGMDANVLRTALQFGGSERFNDRSGLGRFGMGLPNSSVSQARRVEVYTWRPDSAPLFSYLDIDEIAAGQLRRVPAPRSRTLPHWASAAAGLSGTLVVWPVCDRLLYRKASTIRLKLSEALGRTYRYVLWGGVRIILDGEDIRPIDPLLQSAANPPDNISAEPCGKELCYDIKLPGDPTRSSVVRVRFSMLPVHAWAALPQDEKRRLGIIGGAGVSVVRAGREIDYGWHFMGAKRKENYDDWWRCEIRFEPAIDEYFGVTHSKQGVTPHPQLLEVISPDLEQIARTLNARVRREFLRRSSRGASGSRDALESHHRPRHTRDATPHFEAAEIASRRDRLLPPLTRRVRKYRIDTRAMSSASFFAVRVDGDTILLTLNTNHPFYDRVYVPARRSGDAERFRLECLLLAAARAEAGTGVDATSKANPSLGHKDRGAVRERAGINTADTQREAWSDALAAFLTTQR